MSVIVKGGGGAAKQEKTVTAGTYVKEILPDTGKLLSRVVVNPTPTEEKTVTPTTSQQTISPSEGKHLAKVIVNAMEDVTPEVTAQTPIIAEIIEGLVGKAQGATATAETILKGFSAYVGQKLVDGEYIPHGKYVWKKLTAQGGDFVDFVTADSETAYPDGGTQDGYWYEKVVEGIPLELLGCTKYAIDKFTPSSNVNINSVISHSLGEKPKFIFIFADESFTVNSERVYCPKELCALTDKDNKTAGGCHAYGYSTEATFYLQPHDSYHVTDTSVSFYGSAVTSYKAGIEYTIITMA